jgi:hypothetical protein
MVREIRGALVGTEMRRGPFAGLQGQGDLEARLQKASRMIMPLNDYILELSGTRDISAVCILPLSSEMPTIIKPTCIYQATT